MPFTQPRGPQREAQAGFGFEPLSAQTGVAPMAETGLIREISSANLSETP